MTPSFDEIALRNIALVISDILTHTQIGNYLSIAGIPESPQGTNKSDRLFYAFRQKQMQGGCGNNILSFVAMLLNPKRYHKEEDFEDHRARINVKLAFEGIEFDKTGTPHPVAKAKTISEAKERSLKVKQKVHGIGIHHEILPYCEEQWLQENYFHAILEITKSVAQRLRDKSGYTSDGADLVDDCFGLGKDKKPMLAFNLLQSPSEESEHKGFGNFCKVFSVCIEIPKPIMLGY